MIYKFNSVDKNVRKAMRSNKSYDTKLEKHFRSLLSKIGVRYRKNYKLVSDDFSVRIDIAITKLKIAVFLDGCFWHSCPIHGTLPKSNTDYWSAKLARNRVRDALCNDKLKDQGWLVIRIWEHDSDSVKLEKVMEAISFKTISLIDEDSARPT